MILGLVSEYQVQDDDGKKYKLNNYKVAHVLAQKTSFLYHKGTCDFNQIPATYSNSNI